MNIHPVLCEIAGFKVYWYGIAYIAGFYGAWQLAKRLIHPWMSERDLDSLVSWSVLGVIFGGRLGYCFFYDLGHTLSNPLSLLQVRQGGMSFHGGLIGISLSTFLFSKRKQIPLLKIADLIAFTAPLGILFGRFANFINQEHCGKPTKLPWGVVFERVDSVSRHPSQLYEAFGEGFVPLIIGWMLYPRWSKRPGRLSGLFLINYAAARIFIECVRTPDGYFGYLTLGQALCLPMIIIGLKLLKY